MRQLAVRPVLAADTVVASTRDPRQVGRPRREAAASCAGWPGGRTRFAPSSPWPAVRRRGLSCPAPSRCRRCASCAARRADRVRALLRRRRALPTRPAAMPSRASPPPSSSISRGSYSGVNGLPLFETRAAAAPGGHRRPSLDRFSRDLSSRARAEPPQAAARTRTSARKSARASAQPMRTLRP